MPKKNAHPYVDWRGGRPRFSPSPKLRAAGHVARDLKHEDGRWFTLGEAVDWAQAFIAGRKAEPQAKRGRPTAGAHAQRLTVGKMVEAWKASPRWQDGTKRALSPRTRKDYTQKLKVFEDEFPEVWTTPAAAVTLPHLQVCYDELEQRRGLATARGALVVLQACYKWAITRGRVKPLAVNPAQGLEKHMPDPRVRFGTRREMLALVAAADAAGRPDVGDAIVMGLWTGQRQGDRLTLKHGGKLKGRRVFRQGKTGAIVHILEAPVLEARLEAAAERRRAAQVVDPHVLLNEHTWKPWAEDTYRHEFAAVRKAAAKACPSVADFHDQDLRDTAVTWMALAGSTIPEITSVTGHSPETAHSILKHYLARHPEMADAAIRKMLAWYDSNGETEFG